MTTMQHSYVEKAIGYMFGLAGGCLAYIKVHLMFGVGFWGTLQDKAISILWAAFVAFISGAMGVLGKRMIERFYKRKK